MTETIDIKVATPLPSNVVLTLGALIDAAWPNSELVLNEDRYNRQVIYRINNAARQRVDDEDAAALHVEPGADDVEINGLGPDGASVLTPAGVAENLIPVIKAAFEEFPDAENYLEMQLSDPEDGHRYVLTFCRSKGQTPAALREVAERKLTEARGAIHREYSAALWALRSKPRCSEFDNSYEAGVKAALDVVRSLGFPYNDTGADDGEDMSANE